MGGGRGGVGSLGVLAGLHLDVVVLLVIFSCIYLLIVSFSLLSRFLSVECPFVV